MGDEGDTLIQCIDIVTLKKKVSKERTREKNNGKKIFFLVSFKKVNFAR